MSLFFTLSHLVLLFLSPSHQSTSNDSLKQLLLYQQGRHVLKTVQDVKDLDTAVRILTEVDLCICVRPTVDVAREEIAAGLIKWIKDLPKRIAGVQEVNHVRYVNLADVCCRIICEELMRGRSTLNNRTMDMEAVEELTRHSLSDGYVKNFRIDYLLAFDSKLWKEPRLLLKELYIGTLLTQGPEYKKTLAIRFATNYLPLAQHYLLNDEELELSILRFSVQLFTVPSIAEYLFTSTSLFTTITRILRAWFLVDAFPPDLDANDEAPRIFMSFLNSSEMEPRYPRMSCKSNQIENKKYWHILHDLRYLIASPSIKKVLFRQFNEQLRDVTEFLAVLQSMNPQARQIATHVEYETDEWVQAFNLSIHVSLVVEAIGSAFSLNPGEDALPSWMSLVNAVSIVLEKLIPWIRADKLLTGRPRTTLVTKLGRGGSDESGDFEVFCGMIQTQSMSFHHPLHWCLSVILANVPAFMKCLQTEPSAHWSEVFVGGRNKNDSEERIFSRAGFFSVPVHDTFFAVFEVPMSTLAFSAQVRAGAWVRNGFGLREQVMQYRQKILRGRGHDSDVYLLQCAVCALCPEWVLENLIEVFELRSWCLGAVDCLQNKLQFDLDQISLIVEDFMSLILHIFSERTIVANVPVAAKLRREVIHILAGRTLPFSEIQKYIPEDCGDDTALLETTLAAVADFRMALHGGVYELKPDPAVWAEVDIWFWHLGGRKNEVEEAIKKRSGSTPTPIPLPHLLPSAPTGFRRLDELVSTTTMVGILAAAISNCIRPDCWRTKSDTVLEVALCLIIFGLDATTQFVPDPAYGFENDKKLMKDLVMLTFNIADQQRSLAELVLELWTTVKDNEHMQDIFLTVESIVERLRRIQNDEGLTLLLSTWDSQHNLASRTEPHGCQFDEANLPAEETDVERKRRAAKERQAAIMAEMAAQQLQFMNNNQDGDAAENEEDMLIRDENAMDHSMDEPSPPLPKYQILSKTYDHVSNHIHKKAYNFPSGTCIVCQEDAKSNSDLYGMLGNVYTAKSLNVLPPGNPRAFQSELAAASDSLDVDTTVSMCGEDAIRATIHSYQIPNRHDVLSPTTCGHLIHHKCFQIVYEASTFRRETSLTETTRLGEFLFVPFPLLHSCLLTLPAHAPLRCPLCKSLSNFFIPMVSAPREELLVSSIYHLLTPTYPLMTSLEIMDSWLTQNVTWRASEAESKAGESSLLPMDIDDQEIERMSTPVEFHEGDEPRIDEPRLDALHVHSSATWSNEDSTIAYEYERAIRSEHPVPLFRDLTPYIPSVVASDFLKKIIARVSPCLESVFYYEISAKTMHCPTTKKEFSPALVHYFRRYIEKIAQQPLSTVHKFESDALFADTLFALELRTRGMAGKPSDRLSTKVGILTSVTPLNRTLIRALNEVNNLYKVFHLIQNPSSILDPLEPDSLTKILWISTHTPTAQHNIPLPPTAWECHFARSINAVLGPALLYNTTVNDILVWVKLYYSFNVVKLIMDLMLMKSGLQTLRLPELDDTHTSYFPIAPALAANLSAFMKWGASHMKPRESNEKIDPSFVVLSIRKMLLPLLRSMVLYLYANCYITPTDEDTKMGLEYETEVETEFDRLAIFLHLPTLSDIFGCISNPDSPVVRLMSGWFLSTKDYFEELNELEVALVRPSISKLIDLPDRLGTLLEICSNKTCTQCNQVPVEPAFCLFCGQLVCAQGICCAHDRKGECTTHRLRCSGDIGLFLLVKKNGVLLLHNSSGAVIDSPYVDSHGESDFMLKRGKPMVLNPVKYELIRSLFLTGSLPNHISKKMESFDMTGWLSF